QRAIGYGVVQLQSLRYADTGEAGGSGGIPQYGTGGGGEMEVALLMPRIPCSGFSHQNFCHVHERQRLTFGGSEPLFQRAAGWVRVNCEDTAASWIIPAAKQWKQTRMRQALKRRP